MGRGAVLCRPDARDCFGDDRGRDWRVPSSLPPPTQTSSFPLLVSPFELHCGTYFGAKPNSSLIAGVNFLEAFGDEGRLFEVDEEDRDFDMGKEGEKSVGGVLS